jgi:sulfate permease, SulP family
MLSAFLKITPFVPWLRNYQTSFLRNDITAGLTVAVVAIPASMAFALIAGLPVQVGLYASILPTILGCLWGSSAHLITGPTTAVSFLVLAALNTLAEPGSPHYVELAFALALVVGLIQAGLGIVRLGVFLNFISHSVILGFSAGAAVLIAFEQLPNLVGLTVSKKGPMVGILLGVFANLHQVHLITLLLGILTVVVIVLLKKWRPAWPGTLIAMIITGGVVAVFDLSARGVALVGTIPRSLPPIHSPVAVAIENFSALVPGAFTIALLGLVEAVSIAQAIAKQTRQRLDINQEFIGQGISNIGAAFFSGYPGSGSFIRSAINFRSGARTPLSGVIAGLTVAVLVLLAAPLAGSLPKATLAGVLLVVAVEMIHLEDIRRVIRSTRNDAAVLTVTFLGTLLLNIEFAVYAGVLLSIGLHLKTTSHPRIFSTLPDLISGKMVPADYGRMCCQMDIIRVEGSIFFGSSAFVLEDLQRRIRSHPRMLGLLIRMHQVNNFDASGVHLLEQVARELRARGGGLYFSGVNTRVFQVFKNSGLLAEVGETHIRTSTRAAIREAMREAFCPMVCAACGVAVFQECRELKRGNWEILGKGAAPRCGHSAAEHLAMAPKKESRLEWPA